MIVHSSQPFIDIEGLGKSYTTPNGAQKVLDGLDLQVAPGETVAVLGVSGTGKSTLLNILGGLDYADAGQVGVNGVELTSLDPAALTRYRAASVGFIFQFYNLIPGLTAVENILAALQALRRTTPEDDMRCLEVLAAVGLEGKADTFPDRLSGGEQQRVAIARALIKPNPIILADEPTGNLDPHTAHTIMQLLIERASTTGVPLVMVTHDHNAARYTDHAYELQEGRLVLR